MPDKAVIFWIGVANFALGVAVIGVAAVLAYAVLRKFMIKKQSREIDAEVRSLVQEHLAKGTEVEELEDAGRHER